eukprot:scaffold7195_cov417-Prasinococcus_capsulatus_cf.AAC.5
METQLTRDGRGPCFSGRRPATSPSTMAQDAGPSIAGTPPPAWPTFAEGWFRNPTLSLPVAPPQPEHESRPGSVH